jgi:D-3-phosphoglycerate dehydrogenase / 2-oxoglutarate reductase
MQSPGGFVVIAEFKAKPGKVEAFLQAAKQHATNSLQNEPGCLQFDVVHDSEAGDRIVMYEVYRDAAAFEEHQASPHLAGMRPILQELSLERRIHKLSRVAHPQKQPPRAGKVLVGVRFLHERLHLLRPLETAGFELKAHPHDRALTEDELIELLPGCMASVAGIEPYTERVFASAPELRIVARMGVGHDQIDLAAATRHRVAVAMAFGTNHEAVADMALTFMAALAHRLTEYDQKVRSGGWGSLFHGRLHGTTLGLVGFGRIGRAVAKRAQGFNMEVLVADPVMDAETVRRLGCRLVDLDELMAAADIVSIHCPLNPTTLNLIDARKLALMKPQAFLVNTARGGIVDEAALAAALNARQIAGAGLDVFAQEPPVGSPLLGLPNVLFTPHVAGTSEWAIEQMARRCVENILSLARGDDPGAGFLLNPDALDRAALPESI